MTMDIINSYFKPQQRAGRMENVGKLEVQRKPKWPWSHLCARWEVKILTQYAQ